MDIILFEPEGLIALGIRDILRWVPGIQFKIIENYSDLIETFLKGHFKLLIINYSLINKYFNELLLLCSKKNTAVLIISSLPRSLISEDTNKLNHCNILYEPFSKDDIIKAIQQCCPEIGNLN